MKSYGPRLANGSWFALMLMLMLVLVLVQVLGKPVGASAATDVADRLENLWKNRQPEQAHALIDSLLPLARDRRDTTLLIHLLGWRGRMHGALGHGAEAIEPLQETLALAQAANDTAFQCIACRWLAVSCTIQGHFAEGRAFYDQLANLAGAAGLKTFLGWGYSGQGYYRSLAGDETGAQALYRQSIRIFREQGLAEPENFVLQLLGESLIDQGAFAEARRCYERSGQIGREKGDFFLQGLSRSNLGNLEIQLGDPQAGLDDFREASRLFIQDGSVHAGLEARLKVASCLVTLQKEKLAGEELIRLQAEAKAGGFLPLQAQILMQRLRLRECAGGRDQILVELQSFLDGPLAGEGNTECMVALSLAEALRRRQGAASALAFLQPRLPALKSRAGRTEFLELDIALGRLQEKTGSHAASLSLLQSAADQADSLQLVGLELQALPPAAAAAEALGKDQLALDLLQRSSRLWMKQRTLPMDPHWREVYGAESRRIYARLAALLLRFPADDPPAIRVARAFDAVQMFKARTLEERLTGPGLDTGDLSGITLEKVQHQVLGMGQVLLDYFLGENEGFVFAVTADTCQVFSLPGSGAIGNRLQLFHDYISDPARALRGGETQVPWPQVVKKIRDEIFFPDPEVLADRTTVIWSPDADLNLFPLTLALEETSCSVFRVPSASILGDFKGQDGTGKIQPASLLAIGRARGDLPAIAGELADLRIFRGTRVQPGLEPLGVSGQLAGADLLHFATHARADDLSPWQSYLEIPALDDSFSFRLDAGAISRMRLPARLVVLAGCESAAGRIVGAEGVQSLANAFLGAGVPSVLATLWPVDDQATRMLIASFYKHLAAGQGTARALHSAQMELSRTDRYHDPFFWAGFIMAGDGDLEIQLEPVSYRGHYFLGLLVAVFLLLAGWRVFRG